MDDVRHFQYLVQEGDVAVREVHGCPGCCAEVVNCADACRDDQVVDDFTIDLRDHLVGHEVGQRPFCVDVVHGLEVLCGFQGPGGLQLAGDRADRVTVNRQGDLGLEGVVFQVVLVVDPRQGILGDGPTGEGDGEFARGVVERGCAGGGLVDFDVGTVGAVVDEHDVGIAVGVEGDLDAWFWLFTVVGVFEVDVDHHGACQDGLVE